MMLSNLAIELMQATVATSTAIVLVLALRRPLRRWAGAGLAYGAWALVPLSLLAMLLPAPSRAPGVVRLEAGAAAWTQLETLATQAAATLDAQGLLLAAWAVGVFGAMLLSWRRQARFQQRIQRRPDAEFDVAEGFGPAVIGLWRPRIVLPVDFQQRYAADQQALVIEHERTHLRRGDLRAQAVCSLLRCVFWFNPLLPMAVRRFQFDQELACDADVLARHPRSRRNYGEAMLNTQLADFGLPVGCHWQSCHPLKERLQMLKHPLPGVLRHRLGKLFVVALVAGGSFAARASQTPPPATEAEATMPTFLAMAPPVYPADAKARKLSGRVDVEVLVAADGSVKDVKVTSSNPAGVFDEAAMTAVRKWTFNPGMDSKSGKPTETRVLVPIQFEAEDEPAISVDAAPQQ